MARSKITFNNWTVDYGDKRISVEIPGDIVNDLMINGIIPDAFFGDNYKQIGWVHEKDWTYRGYFNYSTFNDCLCTDAVFEGIDTFSDIYINDIKVGETDSMFEKFVFPVKKYLKDGKNEVKVVIKSIRNKLSELKNDKYTGCFSNERVLVRKAQCHFGWDWAPDFPGTGIFGKAYLSIGDNYNIENARVEAHSNGKIRIETEVSFNNRKPENPDSFDGSLLISLISPKGVIVANNQIKVFGKINSVNFNITNPELWYPNGYGAQPLYTWKAELQKNGKIVDIKTGTFGIRNLEIHEELIEKTKKSFDIYINGGRFRAIGSNWVPASALTGVITKEKYDSLLSTAKSGGINMLRVWGGGIYENDAFYELCDKYGILVWQDFMFACNTVPDDMPSFRDKIQREAEYQIKRLRNHPCLMLWCGGNELSDSFRVETNNYGRYIIRIMLAGIVNYLDPTRKYVWDSPFSESDVGNDSDTGDCHNNALAIATAHNDISNFRKYQWKNMTNFDTECAVLGMCRFRSFKKFMPEDKMWPQNELWQDRLSCNPYDDSVVQFTDRINYTVEALFGSYSGLKDYIKKSMIAHAEVLKSEIDYYRADFLNSGILNWMYNDIWGNGTWAIVDYYLEKKPAFYAMKRAGKRQVINITYKEDGYYINIINDTASEWKSILVFEHETIAGKTLVKKNQQIEINSYSQKSIKIDFDEKIKQAFLYASFGSEDTYFFYDLWKDKKFISNLSVDIETFDNEAIVKVTANEYARCVSIDLPDGYFADADDNYFDLKKGKTKIVKIKSDKKIQKQDITIKTFLEEWN